MGAETQDLSRWTPRHGWFVGVDSDGCVFDTMARKQTGHFHPLIVRFWGLGAAEAALRESAEFVNLRSRWRGSNRFPALLRTFERYLARPDVRSGPAPRPRLEALRAYVESGLPLGNPSLAREAERTGDPELRRLLDWSRAVDRDIEENMPPVPPFRGARESLAFLRGRADVLVVSQTPEPALRREWALHGLDGFVGAIAGQEQGPKAAQLRRATEGKYPGAARLMIGDAPGDREAAGAAGAWFYPILPGREEFSWARLREEGLPRFLGGRFDPGYQRALGSEFDSALSGAPPGLPPG